MNNQMTLAVSIPSLVLPEEGEYTPTIMSQPTPDFQDNLVELPLFPLNVVLFPGMPMPLHIFEERYKQMIGECVDREAPFGIMLIKEGPEVGGPAEPVRIGTTARIMQVERLQEGRLNIMTTGERRFELVEVTRQLPYLVGQVRYLPEETGDAPSPALDQVKEGYAVFLRNLTSLAGGWTSTAELPDEPVALSFAVASSLATTVAMPGGVKQNILEAPDAAERLTRLVPLLEQGNEALAEEIAKRNPFKGPRLN